MKGLLGNGGRAASRNMLLVLTALLLSFAVGCASDKEARKNDALASQQLALAFLNEGRPARALTELAKAEQSMPDDPEVQNAMGLAYWARRDYASAEARFKKALALRPGFSEAWNNLGAFYLSQGRNNDAVEALEKALGNVYYTSYEMALSNLGLALYNLGRYPEARSRLEEALEVNPSQPAVRQNLSLVLYEEGEYQLALVQVNEALKLYPNYPQALLQKGKILNKVGDREGAAEFFKRTIEVAPASESGKTARTYLDLMEGK